MREMFISEIWSIVRTSHGNAVLLKPQDMEVAVPIFIGTLEMQSILIGRDKVSLPRPLTHDLFLNMLNRINLTIKKVEVYEIKNDTFHARLIITGGEFSNEKPLILDCRPSDSFALAVRGRYPIFLASSVIEQTGMPLDFFIDLIEKNSEPADGDNDKHRSLLEQLEWAVAEEEYEQAAKIRDMLKTLEDEDMSST
ncbi:MAG: bifunctional nuclease family protein [Treponema sp.]|jgi:bifunctional DNase/RNase|nr:bifunctional nuclease family protein [Treponema sp.]